MNKVLVFMLFFFLTSGSFTLAFNPVSASELIEDSWNTKTPMSQPRCSLGVVTVGSKIYAIGGLSVNDKYVGTNEQYDPSTNTWVTLASMPTPRSNFAVVAYQGKIYCIGGERYQNYDGSSDVSRCPCGDVEVYDVVTDSWSAKKNMPFNGSYLDVVVVAENFFVIDGSNLYVYDPVADLWTKKDSIPTDKVSTTNGAIYSSAVANNNRLIVFCSYFTDAGSPCKNKVLIYDLETKVWSEGCAPPYSYAVSGGAIGVTSGFFAPQKIYTLQYTNNYVYDPIDDIWSVAKNMPTERRAFDVAVLDDILYVIGGYSPHHFASHSDFTEPISINEQYTPIGYSFTSLNSEPTATPSLPSESTAALLPSEPVASKSFLAEPIMIVIVLTVCIVVATVLFFYFRKRAKRASTENTQAKVVPVDDC
jgi:N-acetylneuraminic acid mutarotase